METELAKNLIALAAAYGAARKLETATVGRMCAADGRFFLRITEGKTFTVKKYDEVVAWFSDNWPSDAVWPDAIARPDSNDAGDAPVEACSVRPPPRTGQAVVSEVAR